MIFTGVGFMGPFTTAANLYGTEKLLRALRKDPEGAHRLLDFAADITIEVGRKYVENNIGIGLAEPTASLENIDAYMRAARKCAKYPVQPSNWE